MSDQQDFVPFPRIARNTPVSEMAIFTSGWFRFSTCSVTPPTLGVFRIWHTAGVAWEVEFTDEFPRLVGRPLRGTTGRCGALCSASHRIRSRPRFPAQLKSWQFPLSADVSGVNYFFALTTTISPGQRQLLL